MPIYEYKCNKCGHITEIWQKFSDPPLGQCEVCGGSVKKIISQNTFHLKGSGWYVTDYASGSSKNKPAKKEGKEKESKDTNKKDSSKTESKQAPSEKKSE
jgi:putative FmdB family regulatory protein